MSESGLQGGTVTTNSGLSVRVARPKSGAEGYSPQSPQMGNPKAPALQEGVSPRFEQRIGREHGDAVAAKHVEEAHRVESQPNPLRSDGLVDAVMSLHAPSVGGNSLGRGGSLSGLAKQDEAFKPSSKIRSASEARAQQPADVPKPLQSEAHFPSGRDMALHTLGYTPSVQQSMLGSARDRITRRTANSRAPLSSTEVTGRAHAQVQEHLDEAIHGTRDVGSEPKPINDLLSAGGGIETAAGAGNPAPPTTKSKGGGLGMTKSRTPNQRAMRNTAADLTRGGKWNALNDSDALSAGAAQDTAVITAKQKARRAGGKGAEEYNTYSPGADIDSAQRRHAQPVFSTSNPGVGTPSEGPNSNVLPPRQRAGAVSPTPSNLPSGPSVGRSRAQRVPAGPPPTSPIKPKGTRTKVDAPAESNVPVAQTKQAPFAGTGIQEGMAQSRQQNVSLGQRAPQGQRSAANTTR
jgi:hypothetical protein